MIHSLLWLLHIFPPFFWPLPSMHFPSSKKRKKKSFSHPIYHLSSCLSFFWFTEVFSSFSRTDFFVCFSAMEKALKKVFSLLFFQIFFFYLRLKKSNPFHFLWNYLEKPHPLFFWRKVRSPKSLEVIQLWTEVRSRIVKKGENGWFIVFFWHHFFFLMFLLLFFLFFMYRIIIGNYCSWSWRWKRILLGLCLCFSQRNGRLERPFLLFFPRCKIERNCIIYIDVIVTVS